MPWEHRVLGTYGTGSIGTLSISPCAVEAAEKAQTKKSFVFFQNSVSVVSLF